MSTTPQPALEVCAYNIQSVVIAEKAGATRVELCSGPLHGGLTPGHGTLEYVSLRTTIPVYAMIRPRGGDFVYSKDEVAIMMLDIAHCHNMGCEGIVVGALKDDGTVDTELMKRFVDHADPLPVTFHKAFDRAADQMQALEDIITTGCKRILTSGAAHTVTDGAARLKELVSAANGRIVIMPSGGLRSDNILSIREITGANEFHSSCVTDSTGEFIANKAEVDRIMGFLKNHYL